MTDISDDAVRAFMAAEVPGILDEHLSLAIKSIDGDRVRAGLAAALPYLLEQDRTEKKMAIAACPCGGPGRASVHCRLHRDQRLSQCEDGNCPGCYACWGEFWDPDRLATP